MIWISHSETVFQVAFSLDATQLLGLALSADRLAAAAVSAPLEALPQAVFFFFLCAAVCAPPSVRRRLCDAACAPGGRLRAGAHRRAAYALAYALVSPTACLLGRRHLHAQALRQSPPPAVGRRRLMHAAGGMPPAAAASFGGCRLPSAVVAAFGGGRPLRRRVRHPRQRLTPPNAAAAGATYGCGG